MERLIINNNLFFLLAVLIIVSSIMVILTKNPVHSILFLVLVFILATCLFLILQVEFIAMLILVVYLGAIIVLFLFVVMMLNIRITEIKQRFFSYIPIALSFVLIGFAQILFVLLNDFVLPTTTEFNLNFKNLLEIFILNSTNDWILLKSQFDLNNLTNLQLIGIVLYKNFIYPFFLESIILLIAMLGAIVLTSTNNRKNKRQDFYTQNSRNVFSSLRKLS